MPELPEHPTDPNRNKLKKRFGPGIWVDMNDHLHISLAELMEAHGMPNTPENLEKVRELALEMIKELQPNAQIVDRRTPLD
jgi:hypothetical protein